MNPNTETGPARKRAPFRLAALAAMFVVALSGCNSEPQIDPEQERNIRPGQRPAGTPRSEEN